MSNTYMCTHQILVQYIGCQRLIYVILNYTLCFLIFITFNNINYIALYSYYSQIFQNIPISEYFTPTWKRPPATSILIAECLEKNLVALIIVHDECLFTIHIIYVVGVEILCLERESNPQLLHSGPGC